MAWDGQILPSTVPREAVTVVSNKIIMGRSCGGDQGTAYVGTHPAPEEGPPVPA